MDPISARVYQVTVWKPLLVKSAAEPIPALQDGDIKSAMEQDVSAAEAGNTSADDSDTLGFPVFCLQPVLCIR